MSHLNQSHEVESRCTANVPYFTSIKDFPPYEADPPISPLNNVNTTQLLLYCLLGRKGRTTGSSVGSTSTGLNINTSSLSFGTTNVLKSSSFALFSFFPGKGPSIRGSLEKQLTITTRRFVVQFPARTRVSCPLAINGEAEFPTKCAYVQSVLGSTVVELVL